MCGKCVGRCCEGAYSNICVAESGECRRVVL